MTKGELVFVYFMPTGKVIEKLKKAGLVPKKISLNYVSSIPQKILSLTNSSIIFEPSGYHPGGIRIKINPEKFEDGADEMGKLLRQVGLPLYYDRESLVCPVNHLGMNVLGKPLIQNPNTCTEEKSESSTDSL